MRIIEPIHQPLGYRVLRLLPVVFMQRHRVAPVKKQENRILIGYCDRMDENLLASISNLLPAMNRQS